MRKTAIVMLTLVAAFALVACDSNGPGGTGTITVEAFDAPPISEYNVEHVYMFVKTVEAYSVEAGEWDTIGAPNMTLDFLELVNGATGVLADTTLASGTYSQIRLVLADTNHIVVDGVTHDLKIPSGTSSGVKLNVDFEVPEDGEVGLYVDFDVARSVTITGAGGEFILKPSFKAFTMQNAGKVSGTVRNANDVGISHILVTAASAGDTANSFTNATGAYALTLPVGVYTISTTTRQGAQPDTTYEAVDVSGGATLTGYNFQLQ